MCDLYPSIIVSKSGLQGEWRSLGAAEPRFAARGENENEESRADALTEGPAGLHGRAWWNYNRAGWGIGGVAAPRVGSILDMSHCRAAGISQPLRPISQVPMAGGTGGSQVVPKVSTDLRVASSSSLPTTLPGRGAEFSHALRDTLWATDLFNSIPDVYFYMKDREGRWITWNDVSMHLLGFNSREKLYGLTDKEFFPRSVVNAIVYDDKEVLFYGRKIIGRTEAIFDELGLLTWASTTKLPILDKQGKIVGLVGTIRILREVGHLPEYYQQFGRTIEYIRLNISSPIDIDKLAKESNLSTSQFRKRFNQLFGMPPSEFVLRTRLQKAARLLSSSDEPLIRVALECGFCDQSYFTKRFHEFFGLTPLKYRQRAPTARNFAMATTARHRSMQSRHTTRSHPSDQAILA